MRMPRYSGALGVFLLPFLVLLAGTPAEAAEMSFDDAYIIDIPSGWQAHTLEPGYTMFMSPDQQAVFLITTGHSQPKHRELVAPMLKKYDSLRVGRPDLYTDSMPVSSASFQRVIATIIGDHPDRVRVYKSIRALDNNRMREQWGGRALELGK